MKTYLLLNVEDRIWFKPNGAGYTSDLWNAGRYSYDDAARQCGPWENGRPKQVMVLSPESGNAIFTAADLAKVGDWMEKRIDAAIVLAIAVRTAQRGPQTADEWNATCPVGTLVIAYPGDRGGRAIQGATRSEAWKLDNGTPVVLVEGLSGGISLTHVDVIP